MSNKTSFAKISRLPRTVGSKEKKLECNDCGAPSFHIAHMPWCGRTKIINARYTRSSNRIVTDGIPDAPYYGV